MKTKLLALAFALLSFVSYTQTTSIPDSNFEQALITLGIDSDATVNGQVLTSDISGITSLNVSDYSISNLTGIQDFAALETLICHSNFLTTLNVFNNTALTHIDCFNNFISNLTLPNNSTLTRLQCGDNNLTSLNVSSYPLLEELYVYNCSLTELDVSANSALTYLNCRNNSISSLTLPASAPDLYYLSCAQNSLTSLNVSGCTGLEQLYCWENSINDIDLSNNPFLLLLWIWTNNLTSLDLSNNGSIINLDCGDNAISSLNPAQIPNVEFLWCYYNNLSSLDVSTNNSLVVLECGGNTSLSSLTLPNVKTNLISLWAYDMNLSSLNYSEYTLLEDLDIGINNFTSADVSMLPNLFQFYANQNQLTSLNIANGNNDNLTWMWAHDNPPGLCIQVDDLAEATAKSSPNWQRDPGSSFSLNCSLGLDEFSENNVSIFPNPTMSFLTIDLNRNATYSLTNLFGQEIRNGNLLSGINELDISSLSNGLYLLNIDTPEGKVTKKVIRN